MVDYYIKNMIVFCLIGLALNCRIFILLYFPKKYKVTNCDIILTNMVTMGLFISSIVMLSGILIPV